MVNIREGRIPLYHPCRPTAGQEGNPYMLTISGFVVGFLLGLTLAVTVFMLFLLRMQEEGQRRRKPSSVDRYA
jgi:hypothetical protein